MGPTRKLHVFSGEPWLGSGTVEGFPVNQLATVAPSTVIVTANFWEALSYSPYTILLGQWAAYSDTGRFPFPGLPMKQEGWPKNPIYDMYELVALPDGRAYELIGLTNVLGMPASAGGPWKAAGSVAWSPSYTPKLINGIPNGTTAAKVPLVTGIVRNEELFAGRIDHPIHWYGDFGRGGSRALGEGCEWPARDHDVRTPNPLAPPYGAWFRLRKDYPEPLDPQAATVVQALKRHGLILGDGGGQGMAFEPQTTAAWAVSKALIEKITFGDLEAVKTSVMRKNAKSKVGDPDFWLTA